MKGNINQKDYEAEVTAIKTELMNIRDTDKYVALHANPYIPHVLVDNTTKDMPV
ncbi:MAG: hypothetical protein FWF03_03070 [Defluviitaleaceae bacterium]|nr:hypothetical protein [Defluviitaleaceae bacterium]